jgi:drug/metabolite transporter (DMT)-like permease
VAATFYAWWLLHERLSGIQLLGGLVVLTSIAFARRAGRAGSADSAAAPVDPVEHPAPQ